VRKLAVRSHVAALILFGVCAVVSAQPLPPELTDPVNDFAHVIDAEHKAEIEQRIIALKNATGDVVIVATVDTVAPYADIREYIVKMFENHGRGIGERGKDNGALVLVAIKERRVQIEVGYDLEQFVTDGYSGEVSRMMTTYFAHGDYGGGLLEGVTRKAMFEIFKNEGIPFEIRSIDRSELYIADEVLLCGTGVQVSPVIEVDHRKVGSGQIGPIASLASERYFDAVRGRLPEYSHWLTPIE